MADFDKRRSPYVPLDVMLAFGDFGTKLINKWGMEGIAGWMLFLAACKREPVQGQFTYTSDAEAWSKLGATATAYTLDEFFTYTGRCKKTSRTRHGRITYVRVTRWDEWNTSPGNRQNPRKSQENTEELRENTSELPGITAPEVEAEGEREVEDCSTRANGGPERRVYSLPQTAEIELEVQKLLKLGGCDDNSEAVLRSFARQLPLQTVADIRQRAQDKRVGVGWAVKALQGEIDKLGERSAA